MLRSKTNHSHLAVVPVLLALCCIPGCITSREAPYTILEREAFSSLDSANKASRRMDFDGAASYFERACTQFAAIDAMSGLILCRIDTAALYLKTGKTREARDMLSYAIRLADENHEVPLRGTARLYLAFSHLETKDYANALKQLDVGLADVKDREEQRRGLQYRAEALLETGKPEEAISVARDTTGSKIPGRDSYAFSIVARANTKLGRWTAAQEAIERAARLDKQEGLSDLLAYDYELAAGIHEQAGDGAKAIEYATRSLNVNLAINRYDASRRLIRKLVALHQMGDRDNAEIDRLQRLAKRIERLR